MTEKALCGTGGEVTAETMLFSQAGPILGPRGETASKRVFLRMPPLLATKLAAAQPPVPVVYLPWTWAIRPTWSNLCDWIQSEEPYATGNMYGRTLDRSFRRM